MKHLQWIALLVTLLFLLCACAPAPGDTVTYPDGECTHVYGHWYDVTPSTCLVAGEQVRYCKICRATQHREGELPEDPADRNHTPGEAGLCEDCGLPLSS